VFAKNAIATVNAAMQGTGVCLGSAILAALANQLTGCAVYCLDFIRRASYVFANGDIDTADVTMPGTGRATVAGLAD
jgi:hypothetical protein